MGAIAGYDIPPVDWGMSEEEQKNERYLADMEYNDMEQAAFDRYYGI